ncbi:MAG: SGNH/GDSL hydrolase family protein [Lachnospiraceae bacterium]|nr:SGNH/GDSL hydrolase family protein [Lachnospiraceae bacterium]
MKKVLILGDSISMGYREHVREALQGRAEVVYSEGNGCFSKWTLWLVNNWIRVNGAPDIVHWNNGIWDMMDEPPLQGNFSSPEEYLHNLSRIIQVLRTAGVRHIIFATTTYPHPKKEGLDAGTVTRYNAFARTLMEQEGIAVNDLGALIRENIAGYVCGDYLHLTHEGYLACAAKVTEAIEAYL